MRQDTMPTPCRWLEGWRLKKDGHPTRVKCRRIVEHGKSSAQGPLRLVERAKFALLARFDGDEVHGRSLHA